MAFAPTGDIQLDSDVADMKSKKTAYLTAQTNLAAAQAALDAKQAAFTAAQAALVASADIVKADAISFETF